MVATPPPADRDILREMGDLGEQIRAACATVAARAGQVQVEHGAIEAYARTLSGLAPEPDPDPDAHRLLAGRDELAAFWLTLDAINFGSGWFPTLRKRPGRSGYFTVASALRARFARAGPWSAQQLSAMQAAELAAVLDQDPAHELISLLAASLRDLGAHLLLEHNGSFTALVDSVPGAQAMAARLGSWSSFADSSSYHGLAVPFLKRAQLAAADVTRAGVVAFRDLDRLTMFADNLVPHVLRLDGVLSWDPQLVTRVARGELLDHGSPEEVEIRACAVHAVELLVAALPGSCAADVDQLLWNRGQQPRYKASPRHRCRCTAY
ncbi:MAG: hypothetical protein JO206_02785 [Solirubrobacterales bacterium]|nr:hypothetical protein [Solirubrobacterales bacterium]